MQNSVVFAGLLISEKGYTIQPHIVEAITGFQRPGNKTGVRSFLGLCQQLAPYHARLAEVTGGLRDLTKKSTEFQWTGEHEAIFQDAKTILASTEVMAFYRPNAPIGVFTDASKLNGLGFVVANKAIKECIKLAKKNL